MTPKYLSLPEASARQGVAAVEFAIILPFLLVLVIGVVELGFAIRDSLRAQEAAAAAAYYASSHTYDAATSPALINAAALNATTATGVTETTSAVYCGCPGTTGITAATCGTACADGLTARQYLDITTTIPRTTIIGSTLPLPTTITRRATARLQ